MYNILENRVIINLQLHPGCNSVADTRRGAGTSRFCLESASFCSSARGTARTCRQPEKRSNCVPGTPGVVGVCTIHCGRWRMLVGGWFWFSVAMLSSSSTELKSMCYYLRPQGLAVPLSRGGVMARFDRSILGSFLGQWNCSMNAETVLGTENTINRGGDTF